MTTPFETILKTTPPSISEDWLQGRTSLSGILAALALQELSLALVDNNRQPTKPQCTVHSSSVS